jgi:asparagine synthase (glutamine-hydrolysing)
MRDQLTHRGPDDCGSLIREPVGLGHRRLSIIDVAHGHQPMSSPDGRLHIVYNGEVFNHLELRDDLHAAGIRFRTRCDTETVLQAYRHLGPAAVERLRGMFAFAIWDESSATLFLARDRLGIKPLYYHFAHDGSLFFASEIKALFASGALKPELNVTALPEFLANRAPMGDQTLFRGVRRLRPGHTLKWRDGAVDIREYWDVPLDGPLEVETPEGGRVAAFADQFREAVRLRLMSDVPLGVFLSGGLDSAAIAAVMSDLVHEPIKTFSVAFAERDANELRFARIVAGRYRTDHHETVVTPQQFFGALPRLIWQEDEPLAHPSSVPLYFVSRLAAAHVKVVLTGEGSDENLAGYPWYRTSMVNMGLGEHYARWIPGAVRQAVRATLARAPSSSRRIRQLRRTFLFLPIDYDTIVLDNFAAFSRAGIRSVLAPGTYDAVADQDPYDAYHRAFAKASHASPLMRMLYADIKTYLHELLMKQDQMSMAASIESRVPFLDHPLVESLAALPDTYKLRRLTTKHILRRAMHGVLPSAILTRRKMGFPVPIRQWFASTHSSWLGDVLLAPRTLDRQLFDQEYVHRLLSEHRAGVANHADRLWCLLNLELWHRIYVDGEGAPAWPPDAAPRSRVPCA